jgi:uncharacterized membrane protein
MPDVLTIFMRWMHISSVAILIGGILYARLVETPAVAALPPDLRESFADRAAATYRSIVTMAIVCLIVSGIYRIFIARGHSTFYEMLFGVKMLLVLHVFAVAVLIARPHNPRRVRMMTGMAISGLAIIMISAWLSRIY